jgi:hypothetical protein
MSADRRKEFVLGREAIGAFWRGNPTAA